MNRWFMLGRPSDHLHFLPPRRHIDNAQKLRLISSTNHTPTTSSSDAPETRRELLSPSSSTRSNWLTLTGPWRLPLWAERRWHDTFGDDHCNAVPLSDGHHIMFTDEQTGLLCLGADQPIGSARRLSRKVVFEPPTHLLGAEKDRLPFTSVYAVASDLDTGVRIVAAYSDALVLFSVPIDVLRYSTAEQEETLLNTYPPSDETGAVNVSHDALGNLSAVVRSFPEGEESSNIQMLNMAWVHWLNTPRSRIAEASAQIWPLRITGAQFGTIQDPAALAIQVGLTIEVWAFARDGQVETWRG
ncbi:hypothetical protein LTR62_008653 [Meristemomyces frigidus]|uniref:Uncharacterized protein n=1 Tax=Meristemomyces frigidus TaxID=1508187 RepID=A0AAN7TKS0_9PEZI|nr:hypothetical protein LTR62_008653 [Meristemomyces frigidus]